VRKYLRTILVEDASGAQFELYEYRIRRRTFGLPRPHFELDTGETAKWVDANTFELTTTGERFVRVALCSADRESQIALRGMQTKSEAC
jgi:hypothetical protein